MLKLVGYLVACVALFCLVASSAAMSPCDAQPIYNWMLFPVSVVGNNAHATGNTVRTCGMGGNTMWYSITTTAAARLNVTTCGSGTDFDTVLGLFRGSDCSHMTCVLSNDDGCPSSSASQLYYNVEADQQYYIGVSSYNGNSGGNFQLQVSQVLYEACENAQELVGPYDPSVAVTDTTQNGLTTPFITTTCHLTDNTQGVWYSIAPIIGVQMTISTCSPNTQTDTFLSVFANQCVDLRCEWSNDDQCAGNSHASTITFTPTRSHYYVVVSSFSNSNLGQFQLNVTQVVPNLGCNKAIGPVYATSTMQGLQGNTDGAVPFNADVCQGTGPAQWYSFVSKTAGTLTLSTCVQGTNFDTVLNLYDGTVCTELTCLQTNDNDPECTDNAQASTVSAPIEANVPYFAALYGVDGATGPYFMTYQLTTTA